MIGQTISHYKILEKLGEGGMGVVYKAEDQRLGRVVALKFPPPDRLQNTEEVERFNREARAVSALNDPHIATIYELDEADGKKFIAFEYIPGGTLKRSAKGVHDSGRNLSLEQVVDFGVQIAEGLAHAHENGVVHRDLKPDNLLLTDKGRIKITDFGLAKLKGSPELTKSGSTVGTVSYMSPEQTRGEELDARSDLFSLGVILYELATGQLPFRGEHEMAIGYSIVNEDPVSPKTLRADLPDEFADLITRCLEKDKTQRIGSARELVDGLKAIRSARAAGERTGASGSNRTRWVVAGVFAVIAVVAIAVLQFTSRQGPENTARTSIAVLPFDNLSADPDNEYFSDGITEDIITQLSKIADLRVISRTSTMRYKDTDKSLREIGEELNVDAILEGSVRRADDRVRIISQLIDAQTDDHLWAETYDRQLKDIFQVQSDVAEKIVRALEVRLTQEEKGRINTEPTQNMAAYDAYLRGREYYYRYSKDDNEYAVVMFKRAASLDPEFALAYAGLADAYGQRAGRFSGGAVWLDSAYVVANKALDLNPELAEAHKALGLVYQMKGQYSKALVANEKALEFNPNFEDAILNMGWTVMFSGRPDDAIPWYNEAIRRGGKGQLGAFQFSGLGLAYLMLDDLETARDYFDKANDIDPYERVAFVGRTWLDFMEQRYDELRNRLMQFMMFAPDHPFTYHWVGTLDMMTGNLSEARLRLEKAVELEEEQPGSHFGSQQSAVFLAWILMQQGEINKANELLEENSTAIHQAIENGSELGFQFYFLAEAECVRGNRSEALRWMQKAFDSGGVILRLAELDPVLADLRGDAQFQKMAADYQTRITKMRERVESEN